MSDLTFEKISSYRTQLEELKQTLTTNDEHSAEASDIVELDQTRQGRLSRMDALQAQAMSKAVQERRQKQLTEINLALKRIDMGEYGFCQQCDEQITTQRLDINPAVQFCINCAD